jgi:outer membrane protein assembly factor BamE
MNELTLNRALTALAPDWRWLTVCGSFLYYARTFSGHKAPMSVFMQRFLSATAMPFMFFFSCVRSRLSHTAVPAFIVGLCLILSGCSFFPGVYRLDIPQGNLITQQMVDQLRPGLSKRQVTFILGTPLLRDTFDQDRWDYIYGFQPGGGTRSQERLTVYFENDQLIRFAGDFQQTPENSQFPTAPGAAAAAAPAAPPVATPSR